MSDGPVFGKKLDPNNLPGRDATHVAMWPGICGEQNGLYAGQLVRQSKADPRRFISAEYREGEAIGIVDPFLGAQGGRRYVDEGEACWIALLPGSVNGMRHHWSCPSIIEEAPQTSESERWLTGFAEKWGFHYDEMIEAAKNGGDIYASGHDLYCEDELGEDAVLFWYHVEKVIGRKPVDREQVAWRCSC